MADFTESKAAPYQWPENAVEADYGRLEPTISPDQLKYRFLFGIPLVSQIRDPITGQAQILTDDALKDLVSGAMQQAELETGLDIRPVLRKEKKPFDRNTYESYGFFQLEHTPVSNLKHLAVTPANGQEVYSVPLEWVETALAVRGQINIIPMTAAFIQGGYVPAGTSGAAYFFAVLGQRHWVPAYWEIQYVSGFPDGLVPRTVNDLIGTIAAMDILSMLGATYGRAQSYSLGLDGLSQSISTPGPNLFQVRMEELKDKKTQLLKKIKAYGGKKIFTSHI
jgi:hypothetical protein